MLFVKSKDFLLIIEFDDLILLQMINDIFCLDVVYKKFVSFYQNCFIFRRDVYVVLKKEILQKQGYLEKVIYI